jgi:hypothetical protein
LAAGAGLAATLLLQWFGGLWHLWRAEFTGTPWPEARNEVLWDSPDLLYAVLIPGALLFAVVWRRAVEPGPLEAVVAAGARHARRVAEGNAPVTGRPTKEPNDTKKP